MNKMLAALQTVLKAATAPLRFGASRWHWTAFSLGGTTYNYARTLGTARNNAAVQAVVKWVCRTFPEAPIQVLAVARDGTTTPIPDHPLLALLERPNPYYSGLQLWVGTLADLLLTGNAYWFKARAAGSNVVALWWLPAGQVEPRWPDDGRPPFISHYEYTVDGQVYRLDPDDVLHFRDGFDTANIRKGLSPLAALLREVATDDEAANYTSTILRNLGVPGVIISPAGDVTATDADLEEIKDKFAQRFGGDNRGAALVLKGPAHVQVLSFSPEQLQLRELRRIPEERITAIYGVAAIVVGLGAGLDRSTFSNFAEAREAAYESMIIPLQRLLLADLQHRLVPEFGDGATLRLAFDYSQVRVLQDDQNALMKRAVDGYHGGLLTRGEARQMVGEEAEDADDVFYVGPNSATEPRTPEPMPALEAPAALPLAAGAPDGETKAGDLLAATERANGHG